MQLEYFSVSAVGHYNVCPDVSSLANVSWCVCVNSHFSIWKISQVSQQFQIRTRRNLSMSDQLRYEVHVTSCFGFLLCDVCFKACCTSGFQGKLVESTFDHPALGFSGQSMAEHHILVLGSIIHQADGGKHDAETLDMTWNC